MADTPLFANLPPAEQHISALEDEIEIRDSAHELCLADLQFAIAELRELVTVIDSIAQRAMLTEVIHRLERNV